LNDGVFYSFVFHKNLSACQRNAAYAKLTARYVHLCT
jgi:hypothetical protein